MFCEKFVPKHFLFSVFCFFFVTFSKESKQKANTSRIQWYGLSIASTFCTKSERFASYSWIEKVPTWIRMTFKSNFSVTVTDLQLCLANFYFVFLHLFIYLFFDLTNSKLYNYKKVLSGFTLNLAIWRNFECVILTILC